MRRIYPELVWDAERMHLELMQAADECFAEAATSIADFETCWLHAKTVTATKTMVRQACLLGHGGPGRTKGAFWRMAERYLQCEDDAKVADRAYKAGERAGYERYQDFVLYGPGSWYDGVKVPLMVAEVESQSYELLGEFSGLLSVRCPRKYLFIGESPDTFERLSSFVGTAETCATDWGGTTYFVIEIPCEPRKPSTWNGWRADVASHGDAIAFGPIRKG